MISIAVTLLLISSIIDAFTFSWISSECLMPTEHCLRKIWVTRVNFYPSYVSFFSLSVCLHILILIVLVLFQCLTWEQQMLVVWCRSSNRAVLLGTCHKVLRIYSRAWFKCKTHHRIILTTSSSRDHKTNSSTKWAYKLYVEENKIMLGFFFLVWHKIVPPKQSVKIAILLCTLRHDCAYNI